MSHLECSLFMVETMTRSADPPSSVSIVDKFLDLIEKYNLDTSNEDDMARSVTELYQEWLEWCAKRNVSCTKSKQALVAEFVRIHHGAYGATRQQRALEIVQGSHSFDHAGMANAALDRGATEGGTRTGARLSANSARESDKRSRPKPVDSRLSPPPTASAGHPLHSPAADPRPLSPSYHDPYMRSIPSTTLESLHRQIFDDVWRETSGMVQQMCEYTNARSRGTPAISFTYLRYLHVSLHPSRSSRARQRARRRKQCNGSKDRTARDALRQSCPVGPASQSCPRGCSNVGSADARRTNGDA